MVVRYTSLIIFDAPDDSDNSIQSWEKDNNKEISDPDEAGDVQNQDLQNNFGSDI